MCRRMRPSTFHKFTRRLPGTAPQLSVMVMCVNALGDEISEHAADEHIGGEVLSGPDARKADSGSQAVGHQPGECSRILVSNDARDRPSRGGMLRWKRSASLEKRSAPVALIRALSLEGILHEAGCELQCIVGGNQLLLQIDDSFANQETGFQFVWIKRLSQKIIGAGVHRFQHLLLLGLRGEQNGVCIRLVPPAPEPPAKLDTVDLWQHPVEQGQPGRIRLGEEVPRCLTVFRAQKIKAPFLQVRSNEVPVESGVFGQENTPSALFREPHDRWFSCCIGLHCRKASRLSLTWPTLLLTNSQSG